MKQQQGVVVVQPKYYATFNQTQPPSYWDYENAKIEYGSEEPYEALCKIGRGKYSEVFEGVDNKNGMKVVLKVLKPVKKRKIRREIRILQILKGGTNIIDLYDVVRDENLKIPTLIFPYMENTDFRSMFPKLTDNDIKHYLFELLKALDYAHQRGIFHRDVKPQNIIVDPKTRTLKLIDWGLAEFYHPSQDYNVRVASRYFKGPELLVDYLYYDYSLDIWSTGAMFASMIFKKEPFFQGNDNYDQLEQMVQNNIQKNTILNWIMHTMDSYLSIKFILFICYPKQDWLSFVNQDNANLCSLDAIDLLSKMLLYDHAERITPKDAMLHQYFAELKKN
ncbi:unnamed protein product (macronuclear) [Paramecium tetraurelia]|uniref:non-specific serine/threonine protein kinase n=1 Tax=Paramecium tetraurelia TaxID=5888 RepID=A0CPR4_PARTE|nr:uncharacterized protein GSPATT00009173001 [Paramecium tetraurelia]CAK72781.1 unnamed protein product [Paramecium tetraurelia]|eukprot:XP_001440178.1 hypothetical protein (macronuclear) [Paramecium tetraurelia strain d4-2]